MIGLCCFRIVLAITLFTLMTAASGWAQPVHIGNAEPLLSARTVVLEEKWQIGGEDSEHILGMMVDCGADEDGNIYLLDNQLCQVGVYSPDGNFLRTLSRLGEGPGEVRGPVSLAFLPDGILGLLEVFPAKLVKLTPMGEPVGSVSLISDNKVQTGFNFGVNCQYRSGVLLEAGMRGTMTEDGQKRLHYLARFSESGEELVRFCESESIIAFNPPSFVEEDVLPAFWFGNAVGPDGRVYTATERNQYKIEVYSPDGELLQIIERDFENWPRNKRDRRRMQALVDAWYNEFPGEVKKTFAKNEPAISEMFVDDEGVLWVQHSRSGRDQPEGILLTYDTFDAGGNYLQEVSIAVDGDSANDGLFHLGGGRVLLIRGYVLARWASLSPGGRVDFGEEEEAAPMEVIFCTIVEP